MLVKKNRLLAIIMVVAMLVALLPAMAFGLEPVEPVPNYAFIPNSGEASVSKVDLVNMEEVARYYTAPRVGDLVDFEGNETLIGNTVDPIRWRTSRIAMDKDGNAWVLNTGADGYRPTSSLYPGSPISLVGSVVRIQADTSELVTTHTYPDPVLDFGTDEAVQVFPVGLAGEVPRSIAIDSEGYIWIGFYSGGYLMKYDPVSLLPVAGPFRLGEGTANNIKFYEMKFDKDGILWISSRSSTPTVPGVEGVYSFDGATFTLEWSTNPYALLIDPVSGEVFATSYSNVIWRSSTGLTTVIPNATNLRGMAFDENGVIWIANTSGASGGTKVYSFDPVSGLPGLVYTLTVGNTPVGVGRDEAGLMWAICRTDNQSLGFIEAFDPSDASFAGSVQVGNRPYAYGDFVVPPPTYCICGYKIDADTELGLGNWTINLHKWNADLGDTGEWEFVKSTTTSAIDGKYCFDGLLAGEYKVSEVLKNGWEQILPANNKYEVSLPEGASNCEAVLGQGVFYNFVNAKLYEISGYKYRSGTELGLGGWLIKLEKWVDEAWVPVAMTATDINGAYSFTGLLAGDYRVSETLKPGWTQTSPIDGVHLVTLPYEGDPLSYDFENQPDMKCYDDTIWAYGGEDGEYTDGAAAEVVENNTVLGNTSNNWGWTNLIEEEGTYVFTLYRGAGQNDLDNGTPVGTLTVVFDGEFAKITYEVAEPYTLSEAHLWVGETMLPLVSRTVRGVTTYTPTSAPGQLANLGFSPEISPDGLTATITVEIDAPFWVAAHGVVDWCEMIPINETVYYHWGVGYPYGATPETYAVASVSPEGMMDVWWYSDGSLIAAGWYHDIYTIVETPGFAAFPVANLNEPVKLLHGIHYPGVDTTYYTRTAVDVSLVPAPNAMSILIP